MYTPARARLDISALTELYFTNLNYITLISELHKALMFYKIMCKDFGWYWFILGVPEQINESVLLFTDEDSYSPLS